MPRMSPKGRRAQPVISLQEHFESLDAERLNASTRLEAERDLRYQQRWEAQNKAVETAMAAAEKAVAAALLAAEKAVGKAEIANEKRFDNANEWRDTYGDRDRLQVSRTEYEAGLSNVVEKVAALGKAQDRRIGSSAGISQGWSYLLGVVSILISAGVLVFLVIRG